jgi:hypothetical protein
MFVLIIDVPLLVDAGWIPHALTRCAELPGFLDILPIASLSTPLAWTRVTA